MKNATCMKVAWSLPKSPNGKIRKISLFADDRVVFVGMNGNETEFRISGLEPNTCLGLSLTICNRLGCASTPITILCTEESPPNGHLYIEVPSASSTQIQVKFYSDSAFKSNGALIFSVFLRGNFLNNFTKAQIASLKLSGFQFVSSRSLNLLNATIMNTRYGILDQILPFTNYTVYVNASNSKGFVMSDEVNIVTSKAMPDLLIPPQFVAAKTDSLQVEWYAPILVNSDDFVFYFQLEYKVKYLWDINGSIQRPKYENNVSQVFYAKTLARSHVLTKLRPFTAYSFRLTAGNSFGETRSDWSEDYLTLPDIPNSLDDPALVNLTTSTAFIKWKSPQNSNGKINAFKIYVYEEGADLRRNFSVGEGFNEFLVESLGSFVFYEFVLEACNLAGCVSAKNRVSGQTLASAPSLINPPSLSSPSSFSVIITWSEPGHPNGKISGYIVERRSLSRVEKLVKHRFSPDKNNFLDFEGLEACGVYQYRVFVLNQAGNGSSQWSNVTVAAAKPLVVPPVVVNLISSDTVRFEWLRPVTLCQITRYVLNFNSSNSVPFKVTIEPDHQSTLVSRFFPYTINTVSLIACVGVDECTQSLAKVFRTPGSIPQGLSAPKTRLVGPRVVSIEWIEPLKPNGESIQYQLIRSSKQNLTETLYIGSSLFYLDSTLPYNESFRYLVVYSNEFGNSQSDLSPFISIPLNFSISSTIQLIGPNLKGFLMIFGLRVQCELPTLSFLTWTRLKNEELFNYFIKIVQDSSILATELRIEKSTVFFNDLTINQTMEIDIASNVTNFTVSHLIPEHSYSFQLFTYFNTETKARYRVFSESSQCATSSVSAFFNDPLALSPIDDVYLNVKYSLGDLLVQTYPSLSIKLNEFYFTTNLTRQIDFKELIKLPKGILTFGPLQHNKIYFTTIKACSIIYTEDCIQLSPIFYSPTLLPPQNLSDLNLVTINSTSIQIDWFPPLVPNDFYLTYSLYRRQSCNQTLTQTLNICTNSYCSQSEPIISFECLVQRPKNFVCCGGNFYESKPGFKCCGKIFYVQVGPQEICCEGAFGELRANIGLGDSCCADKPYYINGSQKCCNSQLIAKKLYNLNRYFYSSDLLIYNECPYLFESDLPCKSFELTQNQSSRGFLDSHLIPYTSYDYRMCVKNSVASTCSPLIFNASTQLSLASNFSFLSFKLLQDDAVLIFWNEPVFLNGPLESYRLYRNEKLVYSGKNLNFIDQSNLIQSYFSFKYEVEVCNPIGCVFNENCLLISVRDKTPEDFKQVLVKVKNFSFGIN